MNKAFVREPDDAGQRYCPACQSLGVAVSAETWRAHVSSPDSTHLAGAAFFCLFARCDVVYFDEFERVVRVAEVAEPVWPKDPDAPLCACFGFTSDDVEDDLRERGVRRVRELLEKAKSPAAACRIKAPSGQCCVAEVQRYFLKRRAESGAG